VRGKAGAQETAIGHLPRPQDLDLRGLGIARETLDELLAVHPEQWQREMTEMREYLADFGARVPPELYAEIDGVVQRLAPR
jgi:phosphoenolpyruvate carboxykinase (GTP)